MTDRTEFYPYSAIIFAINTIKYDHFAMQRFINSWKNKKFLVIRERYGDPEAVRQTGSARHVDVEDLLQDFEIVTRNFLSDFIFKAKSAKVGKGVDINALSKRLENVATSIELMRLNSLAHIVEEIRKIREQLDGLAVDSQGGANIVPVNTARNKIKDVLIVISSIFDAIEDSRLAAMIVAGSVSAVVGYVGWSAVACSALYLASWHGKEAFIAALRKLPIGSMK